MKIYLQRPLSFACGLVHTLVDGPVVLLVDIRNRAREQNKLISGFRAYVLVSNFLFLGAWVIQMIHCQVRLLTYRQIPHGEGTYRTTSRQGLSAFPQNGARLSSGSAVRCSELLLAR